VTHSQPQGERRPSRVSGLTALLGSIVLASTVACGGAVEDARGGFDPRGVIDGGASTGGAGAMEAGAPPLGTAAAAGTGTTVSGGAPSAGSGGSGVGGAAGSAGGSLFVPCRDETRLAGIDGQPTGFLQCGGDAVHRAEQRACASHLPRTNHGCSSQAPGSECSTDADCAQVTNGYCDPQTVFLSDTLTSVCVCNAGCVSDADCAAGEICQCGDPVGACVPASCLIDADCRGGLCLTYQWPPGGQAAGICAGAGFGGFQCQSARDLCAQDADCPDPNLSRCVFVDGRRTCYGAWTCN
jgi:hypothetical protein